MNNAWRERKQSPGDQCSYKGLFKEKQEYRGEEKVIITSFAGDCQEVQSKEIDWGWGGIVEEEHDETKNHILKNRPNNAVIYKGRRHGEARRTKD